MSNDSRLTEEKDSELSRKILLALSNGDLDEAERIGNERDKLEQSARTVSASEAVGDPEPATHEESDLYVPEEEVAEPIFRDADDTDTAEPEKVDPREGLHLPQDAETTPAAAEEHVADAPPEHAPQEPVEEQTKETDTSDARQAPQAPQGFPQGPVEADDTSLPSTESDFNYDDTYDYDDSNQEEKSNPVEKLLQWVLEDESGNRKWIVAGATTIVVILLIFVGILVTSRGGGDDPAPAPEPTQESSAPQEPQQQAAELPGVIQPINVTARCANEDTNPTSMFDPNKSVAWICQRALGVDGVVAEIDFGKDVTISQVSLVPGFDYLSNTGTNEWTNYRTVTRVAWQFDEAGKETVIQDIVPAQGSEATKSLEQPYTTRKIYMKILSTEKSDPAAPDAEPGSPQDAFAVSSVTVTGTGA